ncbi:hypothetical protein H6F51_03450 [Cyanobacteria bacterium FACHB-DQ100]|nr:hypothetical protein [Cyanobacteria bacterium FACHB-DQ100]
MQNTNENPSRMDERDVGPADTNAAEATPGLIHLHFGAGRLGLGLIAPWFQKPGSKLYLFNRAVSGTNATGSTALDAVRRNELLRDHPQKSYLIQQPGESASNGVAVRYDGFFAYDEENPEAAVREIAGQIGPETSVIVTASVLKPENYRAVLRALDILSQKKQSEPDAMGRVFLIACENTLIASEVLEHECLQDLITPETRRHVTPVHALVDRMCVGLEEDDSHSHPTVLVRAEEYGVVKLELCPETEEMAELCRDSRIEWSRHVEVEKQIKSWQLNGAHWLIALHALDTHDNKTDFKLKEFFESSPENHQFTRDVMQEISEGIAILLRKDPTYADFVRDVDVEVYLAGNAASILRRFETTDDSITRILARFHTPTPDNYDTIQSFSKRFADRVDLPMKAHMSAKGATPATDTGIKSLYHLISQGNFIDTVQSASEPDSEPGSQSATRGA